jgi:hypothetical protein
MTSSWNGGIRVRFWAESRLLLTNKIVHTGHVIHRASYQVFVGDIAREMKLVTKFYSPTNAPFY